MTTSEYISSLNQRYKLGNSTEHTFRGDLQQLIESLIPEIKATNEPKRQHCGAPDYILTKGEVPVGFIEAKDIGDSDLTGKKKSGHKEQFDRYKASLGNLIFTDYLRFVLYLEGELVTEIAIGEVIDGSIEPLSEHFNSFENLLKDFVIHVGQTIKSPKRLANMMAGKARLLADVIEKTLKRDLEDNLNVKSSLEQQYDAFKEYLIHDVSTKGFADIYAQTITYGLFAARLHDPTIQTFSRHEAAQLIPKSNPFLRNLFQFIAGYELDDNLIWIVDSLVDIFLHSNVEKILKDYGKNTKKEDPIIHFYEDFLSAYDPEQKIKRGVWYTPAPVVNFIVRAVDDILKTEFDMPQGLADTSKTTVKLDTQNVDKRFDKGYKQVEQEVHKVQILDPATGTGTFLAEVVKLIQQKFEGQQGIWSNYVENHLLPRLNGFEILMASYAMAHLKLDLQLSETGFKPSSTQRFRIYLTNSLEEHHPDTGTLFANWLSAEANEANHIKRDTPVMCVIGNPPYSINSTNKNDWIHNLISDYKQNLNEKKINLDDDYIKFIRYGQHFIDKNGCGVLAYISNNSFIDGITHRQMRKSLLDSFDKIYILDLHGFAKLKEVNLVAEKDENVFDIKQGVSINIFIKTGKNSSKNVPIINYYEKYGSRQDKYDFLTKNSLKNITWNRLNPTKPYYFFVEKDFSEQTSYNKGFKIMDLFKHSNSGVKTDRDRLFYDSDKKELENRFKTLLSNELTNTFIEKYSVKDSGSYKITSAIKKVEFDEKNIQLSCYRPFDKNYIYYDPELISRPAQKAMAHFNGHSNIGLVLGRQGQVIGHMQWNLIFCINTLADYNIFYRGGGYVFPLYLYPLDEHQKTIEQTATNRKPNLNLKIINQIEELLCLTFTNEKDESDNTFAPIDVLDYIYAVLHSPTYRDKYKEFLKIDFPRVPYPVDSDAFWNLVKLGGELRQIHLLGSSSVEKFITKYPEDGENVITKKITKNNPGFIADEQNPGFGKVWINETQYFDKVPVIAWDFYIGGYQPAQKWLKDRKDHKLEFDDILQYQRIIVALSETDRLMKEIDKIPID
ncbi:type ISP restriction/modification enzyme [Allomuricauda taeanensis]|uniref:type ISP restriction/modification enzyme n=1 Tax=Flagellimonas taeanensis TaxID=1005926 RepID=UPI002E7B2EE9|nr:type ISP restriction/modification enzyme [Allomuricauda taeanensis]MEE1961999.1 type ISP restriction/modification enzyme [Allomuricauda taeanensis]